MIKITDSKMIQYMIYQRTELDQSSFLFWLQIKILHKISVLNKLYKPLVFLRVILNRKKICEGFQKSIEEDYKEIKPYLPNVERPVIVDVGSGVAGIDLKIYNHYGQAELCLVDKSRTEPNIWYGFTGRGAYYNSLEVAREFLCLNGVAPNHIHLVDADLFPTLSVQADFVISLLSWGYHYPVSTYLSQVYKLLKPNGILILDIRRNSEGVKELKEIFKSIEIIKQSQTDSLVRVKAVKSLESPLGVDIGRNLPQEPSAKPD